MSGSRAELEEEGGVIIGHVDGGDELEGNIGVRVEIGVDVTAITEFNGEIFVVVMVVVVDITEAEEETALTAEEELLLGTKVRMALEPGKDTTFGGDL